MQGTSPAENPSEFWKRSLIFSYLLGSIISSLDVRFSTEKSPSFLLTDIHPTNTNQ